MSMTSIGAGASTSFASLPSVTQDLTQSALDAATKRAADAKEQAQIDAVKDDAKKAQQQADDQSRLQAQQSARAAVAAYYQNPSAGLNLLA